MSEFRGWRLVINSIFLGIFFNMLEFFKKKVPKPPSKNFWIPPARRVPHSNSKFDKKSENPPP